jgi:hypothetical protein
MGRNRGLPGRRRAALVAAAALLALAAAPRLAAAAGHTCQLVDSGVIEVDGAMDDWQGFGRYRKGPAGDADVSLRCAHDERTLYVMVDVVDDKVVRTRQARAAGEDSLTVSLAASSAAAPLRFRVFPGSPTGPRKLVGVPSWLRVEDTLTEGGYAIELAVPLARLPGHGRSTPVLLAEILVHDADRPAAIAIDDTVGFRGRLHFSSHLPAYKGFLAATRLAARDLKLDQLIDLDASPGTERLVWGGRFVGVLSDGFGFLEIPATSPDDVLAVQVIDPSATGRPLILTHSRQRGANGARELVIVWRLDGGGQFARVLGLEVAQELDGRAIRNRWELVAAGTARKSKKKPRARALDLVVEAGEVTGWDPADHARVQPSTDVTPVLTPWGERAAAVYWFDGDVAMGPEPMTGRRTAKKKR